MVAVIIVREQRRQVPRSRSSSRKGSSYFLLPTARRTADTTRQSVLAELNSC